MRRMTVLLALLSVCAVARADFLYLKDGNVIECKIIRAVNDARGKPVSVEVEDEKGEKKTFELNELDPKAANGGWVKGPTSWEIRADNKKWYETESPRVLKTWDAEANFARKCREKELFDEAMTHFKEAYDLRAAMPLEKTETEAARHTKLAEFLEKDCGMFDEALSENQKLYAVIKGNSTTAAQHASMADWCAKRYLYQEAEEEFQTALKAEAENKVILKAYDQFKVARAVPINHEMYDLLKPRLEIACKYLKSNEFLNADGSMGKDAEEAGVQSLRGMTAMTAEALMAEWDLKYLDNPVTAGTPPKQVTDALNFLLTGKKGTGRFYGDDLWGPNLTLQFLIRCSTRPYLADRRADVLKGIDTAIEDLKKLQRPDGGWNYYGAPVVRDNTSCSFLSAAILVNLVAARNMGVNVEPSMISKAKDFIADLKFGEGTYLYSKETEKEKGANRSFSSVGACARSPLCELSAMAAGGGSMESLKQTLRNFMAGHDWLKKLKGSASTHVGKGRTAPYYYMFSHFWTARAILQLPRQYIHQFQMYMAGQIVLSQEPDGTFKDFTGTKAYKLYATALGVLAMHELICSEPDPAFKVIKTAKNDFVTTVSTGDASPSEVKPADKSKK